MSPSSLRIAALLAALSSAAAANSIGINFTNGDADKSLTAGTSAGVVSQTNWNQHTNASGIQTSTALSDSAGLTTTAGITTTFGFANANGGNGTPPSNNDNLFRAYGLFFGNEAVTVNNLPDSITANGYDVIVYFDINLGIADRTMAYTIGDTTLVAVEDTGFFSGTFTEATGTSLATANSGNYVHFRGLGGTSFTMTGSDLNSARAAVCALQIIPSEPSATIAGFSATPGTITAGDTVNLAWEVTDADSVTIDQGVGPVGNTGTLNVTPSATTTWTLTATRGTTIRTARATASIGLGPIDVYLLGGQSNMQGTARTSKLPTELRNIPEIKLYASGSGVQGAINSQWVNLQPANGSSFGLEIGLGEKLATLRPGRALALIKYAGSGTSLELDWRPGADANDTGNRGPQFNAFTNTVNSGLAALEAEGWTPVIHGMCWHQGEADAKDGLNVAESSTSADDYGANLSHFIGRIREQFSTSAAPDGIRFVPSQVLPYAPAGGDVVARFPGRDLVRQAILNADRNSGAPFSVANTIAVPTNEIDHPSHEQEIDGYRDNDEVHQNATALLTLGRSMAYALLDLEPVNYQDWSNSYSLAGAATDDDDHDGLTNEEEYFFGGNPTDSTSTPQPSLEMIEDESGAPFFSYTVSQSLETLGTSLTAEISTDLEDWASFTPQLHSIVHTPNGTSLLSYRAPWSISDPDRILTFFRTSHRSQ